MLNIKNLCVNVDNKLVLSDINLEFELGKNYCILGKNGSGKSSLALALMGNPKYKIESGDLYFDDIHINELKPDERAKLGIFLAFQNIPEIKGVKLFEFLRSIYSAKISENTSFLKFKQIILPLLEELHIDKEFLRRDLNVGFSGGEKRKIEALQIRLLEPKYILLDEIDSGLDIDAERKIIEVFKKLNNKDNSFIIITHKFDILDYLEIDSVFVLKNGVIVRRGKMDMVADIKKGGFDLLD